MYCEGCGEILGSRESAKAWRAIYDAASRLHEAAAQPDSPLRHSPEAHAMYRALLDIDRLWIEARKK